MLSESSTTGQTFCTSLPGVLWISRGGITPGDEHEQGTLRQRPRICPLRRDKSHAPSHFQFYPTPGPDPSRVAFWQMLLLFR